MQNPLKNLDQFGRNIIIVFIGTSLVNFLNLLYQLLIVHKLSVSEFAAFNALLSIFIVISSTLGTLQLAVAKYCAEFNAQNQINKAKFLLSSLFRKTIVLSLLTLLIFWIPSVRIMNMLKISSSSCGYLLAGALALSWILPVLLGGVQGLELFGWYTSTYVIMGALKLALAFIFIALGFNIAGALGALLASSLIGIIIFYFPLRRFLFIKKTGEDRDCIDYKEIFLYLFPLATSYFCFYALVSFDMVLVRYFFMPQDSGLYSLAQMLGKIFLFLPMAISIVMFPKTSGLKAKNMDTMSTLRRSLLYTAILCIIAGLVYNLFPAFILKLLTGKVYLESITLGRLFSISMSFFALLFILISYFLSLKDLRFIKYLVIFTFCQFIAIILFHKSLIQIQLVLCINAILLFFIHLFLVYKKAPDPFLFLCKKKLKE